MNGRRDRRRELRPRVHESCGSNREDLPKELDVGNLLGTKPSSAFNALPCEVYIVFVYHVCLWNELSLRLRCGSDAWYEGSVVIIDSQDTYNVQKLLNKYI